jgi:hypothetical protein
MEQEIYDFNNWCKSIRLKTKEVGITEALNTISNRFKQELGLNIWFAIILGHRWSYLAGVMNEDQLCTNLKRVRLLYDFGLISNNLNLLSKKKRNQLISFINELILTAQFSSEF